MKHYIFLIILLILLNGCSYETKDCITASQIIDGDTFKLNDGRSVRLIGIDAPERGQEGYDDSKDYLEELIDGKCLYLEKDISETDQYGRLLRYVYTNYNESNEVFVNLKMIEQGYAVPFEYKPDTKYARLFNETAPG